MAAHNDFGRAAEDAAADLLRSAGWTILDRNWRFHRREVDLIARRGSTVAFVEVRARRTARFGHPLETIGWRKRLDLEAAAMAWLARHGRPRDVYRFDAVVVVAGRPAEHVEDAWRVAR
jgi:putative endonuclease